MIQLFTTSELERLELVFNEEGIYPFNIWQAIVLVTCGTTIILWALDGIITPFFGGNGMPSLIPIVILFGFGFLTKDDLKDCKWDVLLLLAGGLVLGGAISASGLLEVIANGIGDLVGSVSDWVVLLVCSHSLPALLLTLLTSSYRYLCLLSPLVVSLGSLVISFLTLWQLRSFSQ
jgi:sodium-dependent dicarboxylate transporter 2/3/5